jgi:hypothetical protein
VLIQQVAKLYASLSFVSRLATSPSGAVAVSQSVVDVKHRLSMLDGAFLLYVESAVPLFSLALKVHIAARHCAAVACQLCIQASRRLHMCAAKLLAPPLLCQVWQCVLM